MTVAVGDVIRVVAEWDIPDGTIAQLVYHYTGASGTTATDLQIGAAVEQAMDDAFDQIAADVSDEVDGATIETYLWDFVLNRWDGIDVRALVGADGTDVAEMLPHGAAGLVKIFTAAARRQSRKYVHGLTEDTQADGTIAGAQLTALALFAQELDDDIVAGGLTLSYCTFNTDPASPLFETFSLAAQSVQAEGIMGYQRRRRPGTGI